MMGCNRRVVKIDPNVNYYRACAECLEAHEKCVEAGADPAARPEQCIGCPFEDEEDAHPLCGGIGKQILDRQ